MHLLVLGISLFLLASPVVAQDCVGDCDCDGAVTVDEILTVATLALTGGVRHCSCGACPDGQIGVVCVVTALRNALQGCPQPMCLGDCDGEDWASEVVK